ncbi:MAG: SNF2-related protein [Candidatus Sedimenticola sp. 6PFRAG1]
MTGRVDVHQLKPGDEVTHKRYGPGAIEFAKEKSAIVRFEHGLEECRLDSLTHRVSLEAALSSGQWHEPLQVITKCQAAAIQSVNDAWGVFSRSRISLLPHQLWVCHRVSRQWPIRHLVADDVGLGKTIEAGLILWPLLSKGLVRRLLVLCPASLVEQWQVRLREMFDIRLARYTTEADSKKADFWNTHHQVVASLPTLRADRNGRHERMLEAEKWDLMIVDEAHHLNADEASGATLGYRFVEQLLAQEKIESCIFFSGTPHRGKAYGFWALLQLLRPDLFDPKKHDDEQIRRLGEVLIRNNKSLVTDMQGKKLFKPVSVYQETYSYKLEEEEFYALLTEFIETGKAYATSLAAQEGRQVILVLIAMQKLASSSVAAIRTALKGRLGRLCAARLELKEKISLSSEMKSAITKADDESALLSDLENDVDIMLAEATLTLMESEIPNLESLVAAADRVTAETKIEKILNILEERFKNRQVLFFTEYKTTQALLMAALMDRYGDGCVSFINGDEKLEELLLPDGTITSRSINRSDAADLFNEGKVRFLISTEAGGEGIDLQDRCHSLIHVDLPWNPMRLHQRVGRLNRYGQKHPVDVISLRNPATVESRIWDLLNEKLARITSALSGAMDEPEDLLQLVLGMSNTSVFTEIFSSGQSVSKDRLDGWFDTKTETLGGKSAIDTVKALVGNATRFDLSGLKEVPDVDLPHLQKYFENMLSLHRRRPIRSDLGMTFKTPDEWLDEPGMRRKYENMLFDRSAPGGRTAEKILGVGHKIFDKSLKIATEHPVSLTLSSDLERPLLIFQVFDSVTDRTGYMRQAVVGMQQEDQDEWKILRDWEVLNSLNAIDSKEHYSEVNDIPMNVLQDSVKSATIKMTSEVEKFNFPFKVPEFRPMALLWTKNGSDRL